MPANSASFVRICCVAFAFFVSMAEAAQPAHPLIGFTRDEVMNRLGEPKSQIMAGNRTVLLYSRERIILRDGVVVDVEEVGSEVVRRPPSAESVGSAPVPSAPASGERGQSAAPATAPAPAPATAPAPSPAPVVVRPAPSAAPEPKVEIKLVRPPSANYVRPAATQPGTSGSAASVTPPAAAGTAAPKPAPMVEAPATVPSAPVPVAKTSTPPPSDKSTPSSEEVSKAELQAAEAEAKEMKAKAIEATRRRLADAKVSDPDAAPAVSKLLIAILVVAVGGIGFVIWRWRQRQLELAATTVSNTPVGSSVTAPPMPPKGATFTESYLAQLDPARFELLVSAYFNKTGMVAVRAKAGQGAVTQIRISWKGEAKPFAGVLCIAHPPAPIEAKALVPMVAELGADDIRRGHVITTGRFSAGAKQFAGEKQLTLLAGDALLEKLNGLPETARKEIMNAVVAGESAPAA
jgi:hypothetical protein